MLDHENLMKVVRHQLSISDCHNLHYFCRNIPIISAKTDVTASVSEDGGSTDFSFNQEYEGKPRLEQI
jgi:hypothetical protein